MKYCAGLAPDLLDQLKGDMDLAIWCMPLCESLLCSSFRISSGLLGSRCIHLSLQ